jgi:hypothetical protein
MAAMGGVAVRRPLDGSQTDGLSAFDLDTFRAIADHLPDPLTIPTRAEARLDEGLGHDSGLER